MSTSKRPISLKEFAANLPEDIAPSPLEGRFVFGSRLQDTLPYLVKPGAKAEVKLDEVAGMPVSTQAFAYTFDLSDKRQRAQYQEVMNFAYAGWYRIIYVSRHWDDETKNMRVYIEVVERHRVIEAQDSYDRLMDEINNQKARPIS